MSNEELAILGGPKAVTLEGLDDLGLGPTEQKYLRLLADGAARLNVLSSAIGLPNRTISNVVEPFLIRSGLVTKDEQSRRHLTAKGHNHITETVLKLSDD